MLMTMTDQSSILNDHDLKEFARIAMNIKQFDKKNWNSKKCNENVFNITPFIYFWISFQVLITI